MGFFTYLIIAIIIGLVFGLISNRSKSDESYSNSSEIERVPISELEDAIKEQERKKPSTIDNAHKCQTLCEVTLIEKKWMQ